MTSFARHRVPASVLAVAAIFSVQFGNALVGGMFTAVGPLGAAAARLGFAALLLLVFVRPRVRSWDRATWGGAIALGIALAGMNSCIYLAFDRIPLGIAVTIELLGPLAVAAATSRRLLDVGWVVLALGGVLLLGAAPGGGLPLAGVGFALAAAGFWALYIVCSSRLGAKAQGLDPLAVAMTVAAAVVLPLGAGDAVAAFTVQPILIAVFVGAALLTSVIPYTLEFVALRRMSVRVFGVLSSLGPAVAALAGFVVLAQHLTLVQCGAIALVVAACAGVIGTAKRGGV
ncbi:inner membrane transporter RhtA [Leucobacter exalbidus]|uniref:Inner membrane transporter RhtA n=1 Tax=Leucobacter exalbidus TaxID=662960 RepID=A0A940PYM7_9MICO|nr:EamA family transporter [Leucobacter exalbidus]MBP1327456.1 inner membrane transporter RhtA [Leucobacter exalbidus]